MTVLAVHTTSLNVVPAQAGTPRVSACALIATPCCCNGKTV
jgi:hypothetical protein